MPGQTAVGGEHKQRRGDSQEQGENNNKYFLTLIQKPGKSNSSSTGQWGKGGKFEIARRDGWLSLLGHVRTDTIVCLQAGQEAGSRQVKHRDRHTPDIGGNTGHIWPKQNKTRGKSSCVNLNQLNLRDFFLLLLSFFPF